MGAEIVFPIAIGLKWGLIVSVSLGVIYALVFRFRNLFSASHKALRVILYIFAAMLLVPSAICAIATIVWVFVALIWGLVALTGKFEPPSAVLGVAVGFSIVLDALVFGGWWGLNALFRQLNRALQP
jgi:hypothetical protein